MSILSAEDVRLTNPVIDDLLRYFEQKTGKKRLAKRGDFSPQELKPYLPDVCLMEPIYGLDTHVADVKLALQGTAISSFYGEMTGKLVSAHPSSEVRGRITQSCQKCVDTKAPIVTAADALSRERSYLKLQALYIPLSEDGVLINKFFVHLTIEHHTRSIEPQPKNE